MNRPDGHVAAPARPGRSTVGGVVLFAIVLLLLLTSLPFRASTRGTSSDLPTPSPAVPSHPLTSAVVPKWTNLTSSYPGPPAKRAYGDMAYDDALGYDVLFGGENGAAVDGDTWNFTLAHGWHQLSSSSSVAARADAAIGYDSTSSEVVLYGGCEGLTNCPAGDTWAFSGGSWAQNTAGTTPTATLSATISDDPGANGLLMFGGCSSFAVLSSTCNTYIASTYQFTATGGWSTVSSSQNPSARDSSGMAYDPVAGYVLLFGGYTGTQTLGDTWTFQGGQWTNITSTLSQSPPPRSSGAMFWDASTQEVVLYGGNGVSNDIGDTWAFQGGQWTRLSGSGGPSPRDGSMWGAPTGSGEPILFGGQSNGTYEADTWGFSVSLAASASATPTAVDAGQSVSFTSQAGGGQGPYSYAWNFGDGATSSVENTSHTYATATGSPYTATVTVTDSKGATASQSVSISVTALPQVQATASPLTSFVGTNVSFYANVTGGTIPLTYAWDFRDSGSSTAQDPVHSYAVAGNYAVKVVVTDAKGATSTALVNESVKNLPGAFSVSFSANPTSGLVPLTVVFTPTEVNGTSPYTYTWDFGDGGAPSLAPSPTHTYNLSGEFTASVNVSDSAGHQSSFRQGIAVNSPPLTARATATPLQGVAPLTVAFQSQVTGGQAPYSYVWTFEPTAPTSTASAPTYTFNSPAQYNVTLQVADAPSDGKTATAWVEITVNSTTVAPLTVTVQPPGCVVAGISAEFNATVTGGEPPLSLLWDFGDGSPTAETNGTTLAHTYVGAGSFTLNVTVKDGLDRNASTHPAVNVVSAAGCSSPTPGGSATSLSSRDWIIFLGPEALLAGVTVATLAGFRGRKGPEDPAGAPGPW